AATLHAVEDDVRRRARARVRARHPWARTREARRTLAARARQDPRVRRDALLLAHPGQLRPQRRRGGARSVAAAGRARRLRRSVLASPARHRRRRSPRARAWTAPLPLGG